MTETEILIEIKYNEYMKFHNLKNNESVIFTKPQIPKSTKEIICLYNREIKILMTKVTHIYTDMIRISDNEIWIYCDNVIFLYSHSDVLKEKIIEFCKINGLIL